ncbi:MAG: amino acid ABC transporter permease [Herpetosiphonaceae bacterium]|nr:amino acid ABC transporter permease [Herpetosiphonaceae bacterium]
MGPRANELAPASSATSSFTMLRRLPIWLVILVLVGLFVLYSMLTGDYLSTLQFLVIGVRLTVVSAVLSYALALAVGLIIALGRVSRNLLAYNLATLYVEIMRGVPLLVILLYAQFVVVPGLSNWLDLNLHTRLLWQRNSAIAGVIGLALGYAAYLAEVYRAGIESIERGQMEAARSLGMTYGQAMRHVILPQALRRVLPALGNDFIAIMKDTSLLTIISVSELTYYARQEASRTFQYFRTYNAAAFLYLTLTLLLSLGVRYIERRTSGGRR